MHNTPQKQALTNEAPAAIYRERSLLDAVMEEGVREPVAPSLLDLATTEGVGAWSRGRLLVVRDVEVARQDADLDCQGGLFGSVEESNEPVQGLHGTQIPLGAVETDRGSGICICGSRTCGIGPFVQTGGGR